MKAFEVFERLAGFHTIDDDRFRASCPTAAHPHGDRSRGFSGRRFGDKVAVKCAAGCNTADILAAMGLTWQALFIDAGRQHLEINPAANRRQRALEGLRRWRDAELTGLATELRTRDGLIRTINQAVADDLMPECDGLESLATLYENYSALEFEFERLRTGTERDWLELWREYGGARAA